MTDERELDDGLAAFDQLSREMAETNRLLLAVQSEQATRNQQEHTLSAEMQTALRQATEGAKGKPDKNTFISTLDRFDLLPDRSGGVWRGIFLRP